MGIIQKLQDLATAMSQIITLTAQVQTALTALNDFLDGTP